MNTLLAAAVNGTLEGALVTAAVWLALRAAPRRALNAATRYVLWWATLAVVLGLPALHLPRPTQRVPRSPATAAESHAAPAVKLNAARSSTVRER